MTEGRSGPSLEKDQDEERQGLKQLKTLQSKPGI